NDEAASLTTHAVGTEAMLNLPHTYLENDHAGAVQWTATNSGMLGMDLEKGGEDTSSASSEEAKLTQVGPSADERRAADEDKKGEATDLKSAAAQGKDPIPTVLPLQPNPPPPCHSSRSNKGMPPVRFPTSTMMASDADDGNNMYDMAFLTRVVYGTDIYYDVEYFDKAVEEEGGLGSVIINLGVILTGPEGKVVDKGLLVVEYMSSTEGYLGLQIVRDRPNKTLLLHENAYGAKVLQRFFKGAPPKKQPITPLSSTSFVMEDAELFADRTMTNRLATGTHLRTNAHWYELFRTLSYWAASPDKGLLFKGGPKSLTLVGYAYADDARDKENRLSMRGYLFKLGRAAVSWQAKKLQGATKLSSTESELVAAVEAGKGGRKLRFLLWEFQLLKMGVPTTLYVDNMSAMQLSQAGGLQGRMKHVDHRHMWLQDMVRMKN
ncbi:unnamed protein product, partial [Closterium sp. NIES-64]